jgi:hypothetical protein
VLTQTSLDCLRRVADRGGQLYRLSAHPDQTRLNVVNFSAEIDFECREAL